MSRCEKSCKFGIYEQKKIDEVKMLFKRTKSDKTKFIIFTTTLLFISINVMNRLEDGFLKQTIGLVVFLLFFYSLVFKVDPSIKDEIEEKIKEEKGITPLMNAAAIGNFDDVERMCTSGVDVNKATDKGYTALMYAARNNKLNVIEHLLKNGADKDAKTKAGKTAYDFARMNKHQEAESLLK